MGLPPMGIAYHMVQPIEERLCQGMETVLSEIRARVMREGMAVRWHIAKARDILDDPERLKSTVIPLDEHEEARYLSNLPSLITSVEEQDARCAAAWEAAEATTDDRAGYQREWLQLSNLLFEFRYLLRLYGKLVMYPKKPLLERARRAFAASDTSPDEVTQIQRTVRILLSEFIALEEANASDIERWTDLRNELTQAYDKVAVEIAAEHGDGEDILAAARHGLFLASGYYEHRRGYSFPEYARHWVERGVQRQKDR
jgi:hypothetical protein